MPNKRAKENGRKIQKCMMKGNHSKETDGKELIWMTEKMKARREEEGKKRNKN